MSTLGNLELKIEKGMHGRDGTPEERSPAQKRQDRFLRVAERRLSIAVKRLRMLEPLAGPSYARTEEQKEYLLGVLREEMQRIERAFADKRPVQPPIEFPR